MLEISTPALLFPTISLILLAYTNRFLGLASVVRKLHDEHQKSPDQKYVEQIYSLRRRLYLIRNMQAFGVGSLFSCTICIGVLALGLQTFGAICFGLSLFLMMVSLGLSLLEIRISVDALDVHLKNMEQPRD